MRLGVYGGSFDPIHYGHLLLAETAREQLHLDRVLLMVAGQSPLKPHGPKASDQARLEMAKLAVGDAVGIEVCDQEIRRGGISYTVDTLAELKNQNPTAELFFIAGSDQLPSLAKWHQPARIAELATWAFVQRGGDLPLQWECLKPFTSDLQFRAATAAVIQMPAIELSSRDLRARVSRTQSIRFRTPRVVEAYISAQRLYLD